MRYFKTSVAAGLCFALIVNVAYSQSVLDKLKDAIDETVKDNTDSVTTVPATRITGIAALDRETQNCRGRIGRGCDGMYEEFLNPFSVKFPCDGDDELVCVTSAMSIGAIKHDICCDAERAKGVTGHFCGISKLVTKGTAACESEWDQAKRDWNKKNRFQHTWQYRIGSDPTGEAHNWWLGLMPEGVRVKQSNPQPDKIFCHSNSVEKKGGKWVCGADAPASTTVASTNVMVAENQSSTSSAAGANSEVEIYGLSLGMTKQEVIDTLKAKHDSINVTERPITDMVRRMGPDFGNFISFDAPIARSYNMRSVIWPDANSANDSYEIIVNFVDEIPPSTGSFAIAILFRHANTALSFDPKSFFDERYGQYIRSSGPRDERGPSFRGGRTSLTLTGGGSGSRAYVIRHEWDKKTLTAHMTRVREARQEKLPKSDEPF